MTEFADHLHENMRYPVQMKNGCYMAPTVSNCAPVDVKLQGAPPWETYEF